MAKKIKSSTSGSKSSRKLRHAKQKTTKSSSKAQRAGPPPQASSESSRSSPIPDYRGDSSDSASLGKAGSPDHHSLERSSEHHRSTERTPLPHRSQERTPASQAQSEAEGSQESVQYLGIFNKNPSPEIPQTIPPVGDGRIATPTRSVENFTGAGVQELATVPVNDPPLSSLVPLNASASTAAASATPGKAAVASLETASENLLTTPTQVRPLSMQPPRATAQQPAPQLQCNETATYAEASARAESKTLKQTPSTASAKVDGERAPDKSALAPVSARLASAKTTRREVKALQDPEETSKPSSSAKRSREKDVEGQEHSAVAALTALVAQLQGQVAEQIQLSQRLETKLNRNELSQPAKDYYEARAERSDKEVLELTQELEELTAREHARLNAPPTKVQRLENSEYAQRFESIVRSGLWSMDDVHEALEATKQEGKYSAARADAYLKSNAAKAAEQALAKANAEASDEQPAISDQSALGRLLKMSGDTDSINIIVKLKDVHSRSRVKAVHSAIPALSASNLLSLPVVKNDHALGRKGLTFLSQVAQAVSEDCGRCSEFRVELEKQERWKQAKAAEEAKKPKSKAVLAKKSIKLPFKVADSRRDVKKPRTSCTICKEGRIRGRYLYYCEECNRGIHLLCTDWKHIRLASGGKTWFACSDCIAARDRQIENGEFLREYVEVGEDGDSHGLAPQNSEAAGGTDAHDRQDREHSDEVASEDDQHAPVSSRDRAAAPSTNSMHPPITPPRNQAQRLASPRGQQLPFVGSTPNIGNVTDQSFILKSSDVMTGAAPTLQVRDYTMWEADTLTKSGQAAKSEASKASGDTCKGYNKQAYFNWRRKNVNLRDHVRGTGHNLGPLSRAMNVDMRVTVGGQFLDEPVLAFLRPKPVMTEEEIDRWVMEDPEFEWVKKIPDETLLALLDKKFGLKTSDLFLSKQFPADLPMTDDHGDVMYHADIFNSWATQWQTELMALQKSQVNFDGVDLKQTLLNALSTNVIIHKKAVSVKTSSPLILLAHLRNWIMEEEEKAETARNTKDSLLKLQGNNASAKLPQSPRTNGGGGSAASSHGSKASASVLLTQLASHLGVSSNATGEQATAGKPQRALPPHLRPQDNNKVLCRGCGNEWSRAKSIPCFKACKYVEHPGYNARCRDQEFTRKEPLTWRKFRERFPDVPPPPSMLAWEDREQRYGNNGAKRPRDETGPKLT